MIVYLATLTFLCLLALWSTFLPHHLRRVQYLIALVGYGSMSVFIGLRDHVGADWNSYIIILRCIQEGSYFQSFFLVEPLYGFCNHVALALGGDIHLVNLICATILLASLFNFSRLTNMDPNLVLFVAAPYLLFVVGMGYTRQSVAVGLGLNAIGFLRQGRQGMFYLFATLATLSHYSAIVLVLLWWMNSRKRAVIVAAAVALLSPLLLLLIFSPRYLHYFDNSADMQSNGVWSRLLLVLLGLSLVFLQRGRWAAESELRTILLRGAGALCLIMLVSLFLSTLADRICLYLSFVYVLGLGSLVRFSTAPFRYLSLGFVVCVTYAVFLLWFGLSSYAEGAWYPYANAL